MNEYRRIGELLLAKDIVSKEQLEHALVRAHKSRERLGEVLVEMGAVTEDQITACLSEQYGYDTISIDRIHAQPGALSVLDGKYALAHLILPITSSEESFECVLADPMDIEATDLLSSLTHHRLVIYLANPSELRPAIREAYGIDDLGNPVPVKAVKVLPGGKRSSMQADRQAILQAVRSQSAGPRKGILSWFGGSLDRKRKAA